MKLIHTIKRIWKIKKLKDQLDTATRVWVYNFPPGHPGFNSAYNRVTKIENELNILLRDKA